MCEIMLTTCSAPGCETIVMGSGRCVRHESHVARVFLRGRPFVQTARTHIQAAHREGVVLTRADTRPLSELRLT
jgi:hypothetical protein